MGWSLVAPTSPGSQSTSFQLRLDAIAHIVLRHDPSSVDVVHELPTGVHTELGQITVGPWGAKLEAIDTPLSIVSGQLHADNSLAASIPHDGQYELPPRSSERSEIMLLRHGDKISSLKTTTSLTCRWEALSEVQVNSSAIETIDKMTPNGVVETPEEETEDEDPDLDNTITTVKATQSKSQQPRATPQLSNQRSVVIQETPTAARVDGVTDYSANSEMDVDPPLPPETTPSPDATPRNGADPYSTAHTGESQDAASTSGAKPQPQDQSHRHNANAPSLFGPRPLTTRGIINDTPQKPVHPRVVIEKKRASPAIEGSDSEVEELRRSAKRARKVAPSDNDTQDSRMSNIMVDTTPAPATAKKGRKRKSAVTDLQSAVAEIDGLSEKTPSRSQRSSQRSASAPSAEIYTGETPHVATSNSSISDKSQAVKFLKKQGGCLVDSIKESFNVLCVRDGDLHKTPKILQSIATGTPIVVDKWLTDSAKAGHFLSVDAYRPSAPKQEQEWNFKLEDVIGQPQTPFKGHIIHFTTSAHAIYKPFTEIEQVCKVAGASKVTKKKMDKGDHSNVIVVAAEDGDKDAEKLTQDGVTCYYRDIIPKSIFRGNCDLESDEFKVSVSNEVVTGTTREAKNKRGRRG